MDFSAVNVGIVIFVYCLVELVKHFFLKTDKSRTLLPLLCIIFGGVIACVIIAIYPQWMPNCTNYLDAFGVGGMSGAASVGCNQLYKQYQKFSAGIE